MAALYFFSYFQRIAIPGTIFNELQSNFALSAGGVAALGAIYLYIYTGMQIIAGVMADRFGARRVLLAGGALLAAGSILFPLAHTTALLYATRALVALGASLIYLCLVKEVDELFGAKNFILVLGICLFVGYTGGLFGTLPFERLTRSIGWRNSLLLAGIVCGAAWIGSLIFLRNGMTRPRGAVSPLPAIRQILTNRPGYPVLVSGTINFGIYYTFQATIGKKLLQDCCGFSSSRAATFTFVAMLTMMLCILVYGAISRRPGARRPLLLGITIGLLLSSGLMALNLATVCAPALMLAGFIILGAAGASAPLFAGVFKDLNPPEAVATSIGVLNSGCYLCVAVLAQLCGLVLDRYASAARITPTAIVYPVAAYQALLIICMILAGISLISVCFIRENRPQRITADKVAGG